MFLVPPVDHLLPSHVFVGRKIQRQRVKLHVPSILGDELIEHLISMTLGGSVEGHTIHLFGCQRAQGVKSSHTSVIWVHTGCFACEMASRLARGRSQYLGDPNTDRGGSCPYPVETDFSLKDSTGAKLWLLSWR